MLTAHCFQMVSNDKKGSVADVMRPQEFLTGLTCVHVSRLLRWLAVMKKLCITSDRRYNSACGWDEVD